MYENILIPTDGSEQSNRAVEHGLDLAEAFDATVHVLYVVETKATYILTIETEEGEMEQYREYGEELVSEAVDEVGHRGLEGKGIVRTGRISEEIVEYAEENDIDSIVMGGQGRGAIEKYLGSTAEKVVRMSSLPVTILSPRAG